MTKWEYTNRTYRVESGEASAALMPKTQDGLNALGDQGWEVLDLRQTGLEIFVWFKRPVPSEPPAAQPPVATPGPAVLRDS